MYPHNTGHNLQIMIHKSKIDIHNAKYPEFSNLFHSEKNNYLFIYFGLFTIKAQISDTHKKKFSTIISFREGFAHLVSFSTHT